MPTTQAPFATPHPAMPPKKPTTATQTATPTHPDNTAHTLAVSALQFGSAKLSPAQKRFNQLLKQTETLAQKITDTQQLADAHRLVMHQTLAPLEKQYNVLIRDMALWLDGRLQRKGLNAKQKNAAIETLLHMAAVLARDGDTAMAELFDKYSDVSGQDEERAVAADLKSHLEGLLGEPLGDEETEFDNLDDLFFASMAKIQEKMAQEAAARESKQSKRKKTAAQLKAEAAAIAQTQDATGALRSIYRQLVSALHPDRETDPDEQLRKTALMKEANTAYEKRDLLALLQLQLRTELTHPAQMAEMAKDKLAALTTLLKDRVDVLTQELYAVERQMITELKLPMFSTLSPAALRRHLKEAEQMLREDIACMKAELLAVQNDAFFKRWLREQAQARQEAFDCPF